MSTDIEEKVWGAPPERRWRQTLAGYASTAGTILLFVVGVGSCSFGNHHARAVHGSAGSGFYDDFLVSFYWAGEALLAKHGPRVDGVALPISVTGLEEAWGGPRNTEPRADGTIMLAWPSNREDERVVAIARDGTVFMLSRAVKPPRPK